MFKSFPITQNLKQIEQRSRSRCILDTSTNDANKPDEMVLLEKQGRCSQKLRNTTVGNLAQVTQSVGQNMTDISNIGGKKSPSPSSKVCFSFIEFKVQKFQVFFYRFRKLCQI